MDALKSLEEEKLEYRKVLEDEVKNHRRLSRITFLRGILFLPGGAALTYFYAPLGWLVIIGGMIQILNSAFEFQRKDKLQQRLLWIREKYGNPAEDH